MFGSDYPLAPRGEIEPKPSYTDSILAAVSKPSYTVEGFANVVVPQLSSTEERKRIKDKIDVIDQTLNDPRMSFSQESANFVANFIGMLPAYAAFTVAGDVIIGGAATALGVSALEKVGYPALTTGIRKTLPELLKKEGNKYIPKISLADVGKFTAKMFGGYKGQTIPEHVMENYNKETDKLDFGTAVKEWSKDNWGFLLPTLSVGAIGIGFKIFKNIHEVNRGKAIAEKLKEGKDKALNASKQALDEGRITKDEHDLFSAWVENPNDTEALTKKGMKIISDSKLQYDPATASFWFPLMTNEGMTQYKNALFSEITSGIVQTAEDQSLTSFVINNMLDNAITMLRENPNLKDSLEGAIALLNVKLEKQPEILAKIDAILNEHVYSKDKEFFTNPKNSYMFKNKTLTERDLLIKYHELKTNPEKFKDAKAELEQLKKDNPNLETDYEIMTGNIISQENIYKHFKENKLKPEDSSINVPENVKQQLKLDRAEKRAKTKEAKDKINEKRKQYKFESIIDEIKGLTEKLKQNIKNGKYKNMPEYRRLQELGDLRNEAKLSIERIEVEASYEKQRAYSNVLQSYVDIANSSASKFADPNKIVEFLTRQINEKLPKPESTVKTKLVDKVTEAAQKAFNAIRRTEKVEKSAKVEKGTKAKGVKEAEAEGKAEPKTKKAGVAKEYDDIIEPLDELFETLEENISKAASEESRAELELEYGRLKQYAENLDTLEEAVNCFLGK